MKTLTNLFVYLILPAVLWFSIAQLALIFFKGIIP